MRFADLMRLSLDSVRRARLRSVMLLLAMAIGVAAVVVLTALAEGARRYVSGEFQALGTALVIVLPGRTETSGIQVGMTGGETPRDLTLGDAMALQRIPDVLRVAPLVVGSAPVSVDGLERDAPVMGSNADFLTVQHFTMAEGAFLPPGDMDRNEAVAVIGANIARELFRDGRAVGQALRIGDRRFRVIGVLGSEGRMVGMDAQELVIVPTAAAQALFNSESLFRILLETRDRDVMPRVREQVIGMIKERHYGEEDVTVITQDALLGAFDRIFDALSMALAGIASISLAVAGVLIMNVMLVAVSQRTAEVGLLKALGATRRQIVALFLAEAIELSVAGAAIGLAVGYLFNWMVASAYPVLPLVTPVWALVMSVLTALASGIVFGLLPARRAARLDPVVALSGR